MNRKHEVFCCMLVNLLCFKTLFSVEWAELFTSVLPQPWIQTLQERETDRENFGCMSFMASTTWTSVFCVALSVLSEKLSSLRTSEQAGFQVFFVFLFCFLFFCSVNFCTQYVKWNMEQRTKVKTPAVFKKDTIRDRKTDSVLRTFGLFFLKLPFDLSFLLDSWRRANKNGNPEKRNHITRTKKTAKSRDVIWIEASYLKRVCVCLWSNQSFSLLYRVGLSDLGALSKFQERSPNTITIMLFYA